MTPAARDAAAIEILDQWLAGTPAEAALTRWGRASRFAGSKDREAVRDTVFTAIRRRRSALALAGAGAPSGRALLIGLAQDGAGVDLTLWTGEGHAPAPLSDAERVQAAQAAPTANDRADLPDWLIPHFNALPDDLGPGVMQTLRSRAPIHVRVNRRKGDLGAAIDALAADQIAARPVPGVPTALEITGNPRRLRTSAAFAQGLVEMQDANSQRLALFVADFVAPGAEVLDYCAGGGGKSLALAALGYRVSAHDINPARMADIPVRAKRAGARVAVLDGLPARQWPAVLVDAPCSGSGSWRRAPEAKWTLTPEALDNLRRTQAEILDHAAAMVEPGGWVFYATCSVFQAENAAQVDAFYARHGSVERSETMTLYPDALGDGFFISALQLKE